MREITTEIREDIKDTVYEFIAENCEMELEELNGDMLIIDELDGDSLMFLELVEIIAKKYELDIKIQMVGKYLLKNPANSIDEVVQVCCDIYEKENAMVEQ